ncbi:MAG: hypothetical protein ACUVRR_02675 [Candidatus Fervidibacter sp.]|uniref:hypothetical protein n=1 Tax=Candidatus Fervidibacter sp. TaxID=3100871 RepID=UPI00404A6E37
MSASWRDQLFAWLPEERVSEFASLLENTLSLAPDPESALAYLVRIAEMSSNPRWLLEYLLDDPATFEGLMVLLGGSGFAARTLSLHPEYLELLSNRERLARPKGLDQLMLELKTSVEVFRSPAAKWNAVRRFRRRETVRLIAADLLGLIDLTTLTHELSDLAEAILKVGMELLPPESNCRILVVAFGKLGARELNYSSDIDLVIFHEGNTFSSELWARKFVSALTETTEYGRLYRVDLRLRPYGAAGPLTMPLSAAISYYEMHSEPGEKLALLKARPIAGDEGLARKFEEFRKAFVFGAPLEPEEFAWLLRLKLRSEAAFVTDSAVKHGFGGIRDVETSVQFLQLVFAPHFHDLTVRDTLTAIQILQQRGLLDENELSILRDGYLFLRRLEHMLQIAEDLPLQTLPNNERELNRLARCMGLTNAQSLREKFNRHTSQVRRVYETVTGELTKMLGVSEQTMVSLSIASGFEAEASSIKSSGFAQPEEAQKRLRRLVHGEITTGLRWRERVRIMKVLPSLLDAISRTPDPDSALLRLEGLLSTLGPRYTVLDSLSDNVLALRAMALIASVSEPLCQLATRHPERLEALLTGALPEVPDELTVLNEVALTVRQTLTNSGQNLDTLMQILRRLKARFALPLGFSHICRLATGEKVGQALSALADALVGETVKVFMGLTRPKIAVFALGGWGSGELHFGSDLDAVFAHEGDQIYAERLVQQFRSLLGDLTEDGITYRLDLRLRPTGQDGALSSSLDAWREFTNERFEFWMAIAWVRLRFVAGDLGLGETIVKMVGERIYERGLRTEQWKELENLMARIRTEHLPPKGVVDLKHSRGALRDLDLAIAEAQLRWGQIHKALHSPSVRKVLNELAAIDKFWHRRLQAYDRLREWRLWLSWVSPDQPPRFVYGDHIEKLLAWLDANCEPLTQKTLMPVEEAVEQWRLKWQEAVEFVTIPEGGDR